jgi:CRISPR/Cas system-associated protein Cas10 (large subunit of type III CRISPR-Cas system)
MEKENYLLIKGDVIGIQKYIFSVPNKKAAHFLNQHSQEVQVTVEKIGVNLARKLDASPSIGGGNFVIMARKPPNWESIIEGFRKDCEKKVRINKLSIILSFIEAYKKDLTDNYAQSRNLLEKQADKDKLKQGKLIPGFFEPYEFPKGTTYDSEFLDIPVWEDCMENLVDIETGKVPPNKKGIIDFDGLADFTGQRTGSKLLAALKLDVDSLGECFKNLKTKEASDKLSKKLKEFFEQEVKTFRNDQHFNVKNKQHRYKDNIYLVFAGGDDTFVIGGFDALLEFTKLLHEKFEIFSNELWEDIPQIEKKLTFSASINIFKPTYPMLKLAELAENDLEKAKKVSAKKNRITVMGEVFTWKEFSHLLEVSDQLVDLVENKKESKALINRIRESHKGYSAALRHSQEGKLDVPRVWKLFYYLRNVKPENRDEIEKLIKKYEGLIMDAFMKKQKGNPMIFPIAARLAEYKLKNFKS